MKLFSRTLAPLALLVFFLLVPSARANTISGTAYCNLSATDANNTPAPGAAHTGTACATFTTSTINFNNNGANTLGSFINSGTLVGSVNYLNGFNSASSLDFSLFTFTGTAFFSQGLTYSATHDDGTVMMIGNTVVLNLPGATPPVTNTFVFGSASGNYNFQFNYTEAQGGSTYYTDATASPVPEPKSLVLLTTGSVALFGFARLRPASDNRGIEDRPKSIFD